MIFAGVGLNYCRRGSSPLWPTCREPPLAVLSPTRQHLSTADESPPLASEHAAVEATGRSTRQPVSQAAGRTRLRCSPDEPTVASPCRPRRAAPAPPRTSPSTMRATLSVAGPGPRRCEVAVRLEPPPSPLSSGLEPRQPSPPHAPGDLAMSRPSHSPLALHPASRRYAPSPPALLRATAATSHHGPKPPASHRLRRRAAACAQPLPRAA